MRVLFDTVMEEYPDLGKYIGPDAAIIHSVHFEKALTKLSSQQAFLLTDDEKTFIIKLKLLNGLDAPIEMDADNVDPQFNNILKKAHDARTRNLYDFLFLAILNISQLYL